MKSSLAFLLFTAALAAAQDKTTDTTLPGPNDYVYTYPEAKMVFYQEPVYPPTSKDAGHHGLATVKVLVDAKGVVRDAIITNSTGYPLLDQAALDAAPLCKWKPGYHDGWPVASWASYDAEFKLDDKKAEAPGKDAKSFAVLAHRETGVIKESGQPEGKLWLWAGFADGVDTGMVGEVRRRNDITGWVKIADVSIEWVNGSEARGKFVLVNLDFSLHDYDRVYFTVMQPPASAILERGVAEYTAGRVDDALSYFDEVWCLARNNDFIRQAAEQCRSRFQTWTARDISEEQSLTWRRYKNDLMINAKILIDAKEYHAAERLILRVLLVDSANSIALALRDELPTFDFYTDKINWCNRLDSIFAGTAMPRVDEYIPLDSAAVRVSEGTLLYPENKEQMFGRTVIDVLADSCGSVVDVLINESSGYKTFDDAAVKWGRSLKYRPAFAHGHAIASWKQIVVTFGY